MPSKTLLLGIITSSILLFGSCASIKNSLFHTFIDDRDGETIRQSEQYVRSFLENILNTDENYIIKVFARTAISHQPRRTKLMTHSYYVLIINKQEYHTFSYYGTDLTFYSTGAWTLDSRSDIASYEHYLENKSKWDVVELFSEEVIDVRQTIINIISKMDSDVNYYYKDHVNDKPGVDNCNTALIGTIVFKERSE